MTARDLCAAVHEAVRVLPRVRYPFEKRSLPRDGIYFFFETDEVDGHGGERIVRVGTHKNGNFRSRISEHYLLGRSLNIDLDRPAPKDRSIFRKNLGRALICRDGLDYLDVWNIDFTSREKRNAHAHRRDADIETRLEEQITSLLRTAFTFAWIPIEDEAERMGTGALEGRLIGTLAACPSCRATGAWLGLHSPDARICNSGLWQVQHLGHDPITEADLEALRP